MASTPPAFRKNPDHDGRLAMRDFQIAFEKLIDEQREALALVGALGFSYEEAAVTIGCALGTVKSRVSRARKHLAQLLYLEEGASMLTPDTMLNEAAGGRSFLNG